MLPLSVTAHWLFALPRATSVTVPCGMVLPRNLERSEVAPRAAWVSVVKLGNTAVDATESQLCKSGERAKETVYTPPNNGYWLTATKASPLAKKSMLMLLLTRSDLNEIPGPISTSAAVAAVSPINTRECSRLK